MCGWLVDWSVVSFLVGREAPRERQRERERERSEGGRELGLGREYHPTTALTLNQLNSKNFSRLRSKSKCLFSRGFAVCRKLLSS